MFIEIDKINHPERFLFCILIKSADRNITATLTLKSKNKYHTTGTIIKCNRKNRRNSDNILIAIEHIYMTSHFPDMLQLLE
jgi:hypothetical protein